MLFHNDSGISDGLLVSHLNVLPERVKFTTLHDMPHKNGHDLPQVINIILVYHMGLGL